MSRKNGHSGRFQSTLHATRKGQRGAVGIVVAFLLVVLVALLALTINVGQLYFAQRNLEKLAVVAALDASRAESGCFPDGNGTPGTLAAATSAVNAAITANGYQGPDNVMPTVNVEFGSFKSQAGTRVFTAAASPNSPEIDSVRVTLTRPMPTAIIGFPGLGLPASGTLTASASAQHAPTASYDIGSSLATIDTSKSQALNGILNALFGSGSKINLSVASFQGLANASVTLGQLEAALGIANPGDLLTTKLPLGTLVDGLATALGDAGQTAAATTLDQLAALADPSRRTSLGEALGIDESAAESLVGALPINALELLNDLAKSAANGFYPLEVKLATSPNPLVSVRAFLTLGQTAIGQMGERGSAAGRPGINAAGARRTFADTRQLTLRLRFVVNNFTLLAPLAQVKLGVDVSGAQATSNLAAIRCPAITPSGTTKTQPEVDIAVQTAAAKVTLGSFDSSNQANPVTGGSLLNAALGLITLNVTSPVSTTVPGVSQQTLTFIGPFNNMAPPAQNTTESISGPVALGTTVGGLSGSLANNLTVHVLIGTLPAGTVASTLLNTINPVITAVVDPLLNSLGISLGGATVTVRGFGYSNNGEAASTSSVPSLYTQDKPAAGTR